MTYVERTKVGAVGVKYGIIVLCECLADGLELRRGGGHDGDRWRVFCEEGG